MKKALAALVISVGMFAGGAGVAHAAQVQLAVRLVPVPGLPPNPCVGSAMSVGNPDISPGSGTGLAIYLPVAISRAPIGIGELPPNPCDSTPRG